MSDDTLNHDRLAVRLAIIISRLLVGESLSVDTLATDFNVSKRTLRRDFNQRLQYLDLEQKGGVYRLSPQARPGVRTDKDITHFARLTHVAQVFPRLDSRLLSILLNRNTDSPYIVWHPQPKNQPTVFGSFFRLTQAILGRIYISLHLCGELYERVAPYRLIYFDGDWYLAAEHHQHIQVFVLPIITDVILSNDTFERKEDIASLTAATGFIMALPHFRFIREVLAENHRK